MCLKKLVVILLLFSLVLPVFSQSLQEASDEELMQELGMLLTSLENDNQKLKISLTIAQSELTEAKQELTGLRNNYQKVKQLSTDQKSALNELRISLEKLSDENLKQRITAGVLSALIAGVAGLLFGLAQ